MIDGSRLRDLREEIGDEILSQVLTLFRREIEAGFERLRCGQEHAAVLHAIRGSALNVGFTALGRLCEGTDGTATETERLVTVYETSLRLLEGELAILRGSAA